MPNFGEFAGMLRNFADPSLNFTKIIFQSKGKHSQSAEYYYIQTKNVFAEICCRWIFQIFQV